MKKQARYSYTDDGVLSIVMSKARSLFVYGVVVVLYFVMSCYTMSRFDFLIDQQLYLPFATDV